MRRFVILALTFASPLAAQSRDLRNAANTITQADVARRINIIADDSMLGRDTPSRGLELTAQYVADEFRRLGLKPGGDSGTYLQHYPIPRTRIDVANSGIVFRGSQGEIPISLADGARVWFGDPPSAPIMGGLTMIGGVIDSAQLPADLVKDRVVIWPLDLTKPVPSTANNVVEKLFASGAKILVIITNRDAAQFKTLVEAGARERVAFGDGASSSGPFGIEIQDASISSVFPEAQAQFDQLRASPEPIIQQLDDWDGEIAIVRQTLGALTAPNTVGILEGSDPQLKNEYMVFSAHMDHIGISAGQPDSINNGADDDGSGTVGVLELAEAFAARGARPKRSVIFLTVSGEEKGLWGSSYFADHPAVPMANVVADLNIDMIGRNCQDSIVAIGMQHSDLGTTLERVSAAHQELRMKAVHDPWPEENLYFRSDHYNFAKKGVPILFFTSGLHDDYHRPSDSPDKIDGEKEARLLRLLFFFGQEVANTSARPQWNPESYKQIVENGD